MNNQLKLLSITALLSISIPTVTLADSISSQLFPVAPVLFNTSDTHKSYQSRGVIKQINEKDNMIVITQTVGAEQNIKSKDIIYKVEDKSLLHNHHEGEKLTFSFYHMRKYYVITALTNTN